MTKVIYVDVLLALNLFIDYLLLFATARVLHLPTRRGRMILGAVIGACSSLVILLPPQHVVITLLFQLGVAAVMVAASFRLPHVISFFKATTVLFVISALFAGICQALCLLFSPRGALVQSGILYIDIPPLLLVGMTVVSYGVLCVYDRFTRKRVARGDAFYVELCDGEFTVTLRALYDSGHSLQESFSGAPVIVAERAALKAFAEHVEFPFIRSTALKLRYIPFSSLGGDGVLPAFCPTHVYLYADGRQADISGVWVAVCDRLGRGEYDALIGPAVAAQMPAVKKQPCHTKGEH